MTYIQTVIDRQRELARICQQCNSARLGEYGELLGCNANELTKVPCQLAIETVAS